MSKVDWSKAPEGATHFSNGDFWQYGGTYALACSDFIGNFANFGHLWSQITNCEDFEPRPQQWPSESRIDIIGTNGNTAEHYMDETLPQTTRMHYETLAEKAVREKAITTASNFLSEGLRILSERGKQYDPSGKKK